MSRQIFFFLLLCLAGCQTTTERPVAFSSSPADSPSEVARSWDNAHVYVATNDTVLEGSLRDPTFAHRILTLESDAPRPVVIYLHGCDGLHPETHRAFWRGLAEYRFAVFMPDSFARTDREVECGKQRAWTYQARLAEIDYAMTKLSQYAWVDPERIILYGHSEGGVAVSRYPRTDIRGAVISSANCRRYALRVPAIALRSRQDSGVERDGCAKASEQVVLPGKSHEVLDVEQARQRIVSFLLNRIGRQRRECSGLNCGRG